MTKQALEPNAWDENKIDDDDPEVAIPEPIAKPQAKSAPMEETPVKMRAQRKPRVKKAEVLDQGAEIARLKGENALLENRCAKLKAMLVDLVEDL